MRDRVGGRPRADVSPEEARLVHDRDGPLSTSGPPSTTGVLPESFVSVGGASSGPERDIPLSLGPDWSRSSHGNWGWTGLETRGHPGRDSQDTTPTVGPTVPTSPLGGTGDFAFVVIGGGRGRGKTSRRGSWILRYDGHPKYHTGRVGYPSAREPSKPRLPGAKEVIYHNSTPCRNDPQPRTGPGAPVTPEPMDSLYSNKGPKGVGSPRV